MSDTNDAYEAVLADLRAQRDQLDAAIAVLERRPGITPGSATAPPNSTGSVVAVGLPSDAFFGMGLQEAIKKYLSMVKRKQSPKEIMDALERGGFQHTSKRFYGTVYTALSRAAEAGEVVRVRDEWGLAEWYPGLRKEKRIKAQNGKSDEEGTEGREGQE